MKISKTLINEISKLSKADWLKVKTNIDYMFSMEEKKRSKELYISSNKIEEKIKSGPCPVEIEDNKKIASFDDSEAIKNRKTRLEKIRSLAEAINSYQKD
jgi:hypothetical protein